MYLREVYLVGCNCWSENTELLLGQGHSQYMKMAIKLLENMGDPKYFGVTVTNSNWSHVEN